MERDGGDDSGAPQAAHDDVTNASGEEGSRGSLETLGHVRSDAASDERREKVGQVNSFEGTSLRWHGSVRAARSTGAALVKLAVGQTGFASVGVVGLRMAMSRNTGRMRVFVHRGRICCVTILMPRDYGMQMELAVLGRAAVHHRRSGHTLQGDGSGQKPHDRDSRQTPHGQKSSSSGNAAQKVSHRLRAGQADATSTGGRRCPLSQKPRSATAPNANCAISVSSRAPNRLIALGRCIA